MRVLVALLGILLPVSTMASTPAHPSIKQTTVIGKKTAAQGMRYGCYPMVEVRFEIKHIAGNPFDYTENDVQVAIRQPDAGVARIPAFFDGGTTWRARFTPGRTGRHVITGITNNGVAIKAAHPSPSSFEVTGKGIPGFVRRDPKDAHRFIYGNGEVFYPIGHNVAWSDGKPDTVPGMLEKMGKAGENWSRVWMDHWDEKNLDWVEHKTVPLGSLNLDVARHWDAIVNRAGKSGIYFQPVFQHHGQYTSQTDSNWPENPWNAKNGGFLQTPTDFFTSPRAIALTKAKYRYIVARWGYSPNIMAWELFNEVQWTDPIRDGHHSLVAAWHNDMANFIRGQDHYRHLITSSMGIHPEALGDRLDFWQPHEYVPDPLIAVSKLNGLALDRPAFVGEIGPAQGQSEGDGSYLRNCLWGSLMSESSGAAQYWNWSLIDTKSLYSLYRPATAFVRWSRFAEVHGLKAVPASVDTPEHGALSFAPGAGWAQATQTEFTVSPSGEVPGSAAMPAYLQGKPNRKLFPSAAFHVTYAKPGTFAVEIGQVARLGAAVTLSVDGQPVATREFPSTAETANVNVTMVIPVPAGAHTVRVEGTGADWVTINRFTLNPYSPQLGVLAKANDSYSVAWVYRRGDTELAVSGRLSIPGLRSGTYRITWWDTDTGKPHAETRAPVGPDGVLRIETPPISRDAAVLIRRLVR